MDRDGAFSFSSCENFTIKPRGIRRKTSSRFSGIDLLNDNELQVFKSKPVIKVLK